MLSPSTVPVNRVVKGRGPPNCTSKVIFLPSIVPESGETPRWSCKCPSNLFEDFRCRSIAHSSVPRRPCHATCHLPETSGVWRAVDEAEFPRDCAPAEGNEVKVTQTKNEKTQSEIREVKRGSSLGKFFEIKAPSKIKDTAALLQTCKFLRAVVLQQGEARLEIALPTGFPTGLSYFFATTVTFGAAPKLNASNKSSSAGLLVGT
jgi:hypothetical protein